MRIPSTFGDCKRPNKMRRAELAWRRELAARTIADVGHDVLAHNPAAADGVRAALAP